MSGTIQSEGRVVGYSAYEIFLRQFLSQNPGVNPPTEREWLASSITMGNSLLIKINPIQQSAEESKVIDIPVPKESRVCAPSTIIGSLFTGTAHYPEGSDFATRIIRYGSLIQNDEHAAPAERVAEGSMLAQSDNGGHPVPYYSSDISDTDRGQMEGYLSIVDGIILQPGTWTESNIEGGPAKEFTPDLTKSPTIRLRIRGPVSNTVQVLLTGFTLRGIVQGESSTGVSALRSDHPLDGDYLGPTVFPWASKIIFSVPSYFMSFMAPSNYTRKLFDAGEVGTAQSRKVNYAPIIDLADMTPNWVDEAPGEVAMKYLAASDISTAAPGVNILAFANPLSNMPPAMYAGMLQSQNTTIPMSPVDTVAPGTVKLFIADKPSQRDSASHQADQTSQIPGNIGMWIDQESGILYIALQDASGNIVPETLVGISENSISVNSRASENFPKLQGLDSKCIQISTLAGLCYAPKLPIDGLGKPNVQDAEQPTETCIGGIFGATELVKMLSNKAAVDLFGKLARKFLRELPNLTGERVKLTQELSGTTCTGEICVRNSTSGNAGKYADPQMSINLPLRSDANYIEIGGRRLYISNSAPTGNIPEGSLGIGW